MKSSSLGFLIFLTFAVRTTLTSVCDDNAFGLNCQTECHCKNASKCGENLACVCKDKWSGPRCQIKNVAFKKVVNSSPMYTGSTRGKLVEGKVNEKLNIFHTTDVLKAWAVIDLLKPHVVSRVIVHDRPDAVLPVADWKKRSRELDIRVGNTSAIPGSSSRCFYIKKPLFGKSTNGTNGTCMNGPIVGRYVSVQHNLTQPEYMNLAEVEVFGYPFTPNCSVKNTYGCLAKCNCLGNSTCDYLTGSCQKGCANSHIGKNCFSDFRVPGHPRLVNKTETSLSIEWNKYNGSRDDSGRGEIRNLKYRVKIRSSDGMKRSVEPNATDYTFKGLKHSTKYNISMSIVADIGDSTKEGPDGPEVSFVTVCQPVPVQPNVKEDNATTILLAWKDTDCQYEYLVRYKKKSENTWRNTSNNASEVILRNLVPYTDYIIGVSTWNGSEWVRMDEELESRTPEGVPAKVQNLTVTFSNATSLELSWKPPTTANGILLGYIISKKLIRYHACSGNSAENSTTSHLNRTNSRLGNLQPFAEYNIAVQAKTKVGPGENVHLSHSTNETTPHPTTRPPVVNITAGEMVFSDISCKKMNGHWENFVLKYKNLWNNTEIGPIPMKGPKYVISELGLEPNMLYEIRYAWKNAFGSSEFSDPLIYQTEETVPDAPILSSETSVDSSSIKVNWTQPVPPRGNVTAYTISCTATGVKETIETLNVSSLEFTPAKKPGGKWFKYRMRNLTSHVNYTCQVTAKGKKGQSRPSNTAVFITKVGFPSEVVNFTKSVDSNHPIRLEWSPPTRPNGKIEGYHLTCTWKETFSDSSNKKLQKVTKSTLERKMILPELEPSTCYECTIKANTSVGYGQEITRRFWTYPHKPQLFGKPKIRSEDTSDISVTLSLQEIEVRVGNISEYQIVVQHVPFHIDARADRKDVKCARENPHFYLAASFINKLPETFTVGDGSQHGPCPNIQLKKDETYVICIRAINEIDRNKEINTICTDKVTVKKPESHLVVVIVALGFIVIILLIIILAACRYIKNRSEQNADDVQLQALTIQQVHPAIPESNDQTDSEEGADSEAESIYEEVKTRMIPTVDMFLEETARKMIRGQGIRQEYESVHRCIPNASKDAKKPENLKKNRYRNILPYDSNRVKLSTDGDKQDYINASHVKGYLNDDNYIASQGPTPCTIDDMWRMIWEQDVVCIVMLTDLVESTALKKKCEEYWPKEGNAVYGDITVTVEEVTDVTDPLVTVTKFSIEQDQETKNVTHFHYHGWPDHGVPTPASSIVRFIKLVENNREGSRPVIVHCSAGAGRTGTYIGIDFLLKQARDTSRISPILCLQKLRKDRCEMIQNLSQYGFVLRAVIEELCLDHSTRIKTEDFTSKFRTLVDAQSDPSDALIALRRQYKVFRATTPMQNVKSTEYANNAENNSKNRDPDIVPEFLNQPSLDNDGYINAVFVDTITANSRFIATQWPTEETVADFWQMVAEHDSTCVVVMDTATQGYDANVFPDSVSKELNVGSMNVTCTESKHDQATGVEWKQLNIKHNTERQLVRLYQFTKWTENQDAPDATALLQLVESIGSWQHKEGQSKITVVCKNGAERCGLFCGAYDLVSGIMENTYIDVYERMNHLRATRPQFICNFDQYRKVHEVCCLSLKKFDTYSNLT
ncbi:receptor-type tyrosine-protein phosphatase T-like [Tubulanus polymorphus]|uniref:receptor-type tyrosine-protein phosphatase T-like n=1 Tax=Tubulanus polymorphus TaxID=672921 RepID=UPI003DA539D9